MSEMVTTYSHKGVRTLLAAMLAVFALVAACTVFNVQNAYAAGSFSMQYTASDTNQPVAGIDVYAFKVATIEGDQYVLTDAYKEMAIYPDGWNEDGTAPLTDETTWFANQVDVLDAYARAGGDNAVAQGTTDASGSVTLGGLDSGLYLLLTTGELTSDNPHKFASSLLPLTDDDVNLGNVVVEPKVSVPFNPPASLKVVKLWKGDTESDRPASIKVQLYCDGQAYGDVVELSDANAWTYVWDGLDATVNHEWDVVEVDAPAGYNVSLNEDAEAGEVTITNTKQTPPPNTPPTTPNTPTTPTTVTGKLPQTGQLWWPVPVLFCAGLIAVGAGRIVSARSRAK